MGLDMYLKASKSFPGYEHSKSVEKNHFKAILQAAGINENTVTKDSPSLTLNVTVGYWRKANSIHGWFVRNCQEGKDECQEAWVGRDKLKELQTLCESAYKNRDADKAKPVPDELIPQGGFFYGSTDVDEYFWAEIKRTAGMLKKILSNKALETFYFQYHSSW